MKKTISLFLILGIATVLLTSCASFVSKNPNLPSGGQTNVMSTANPVPPGAPLKPQAADISALLQLAFLIGLTLTALCRDETGGSIFAGQPKGDLLPIQGCKRWREEVKKEWDQPTFGILRFVRLALLFWSFFSLTIHIDQLFEWLFWSRAKQPKVNREPHLIALPRETYYASRSVFIIWMLFSWTHRQNWECWVCAYFITDIVLSIAAGVFVWGRYSIDPSRSFLLSLLNYAEVTMAFAIIYLNCGALQVTVNPAFTVTVMDALYFSVVTATTVGYGDMVTSQRYHWLAIVQLAVFILFALVFLTALAARVSPQTRKKPEDEELKDAENKNDRGLTD
jgi:hypothetical protein